MALAIQEVHSVVQAATQNVAYKGYADGSVEFFGDHIETLTGYRRHDFNTKKIKWIDLIEAEDRPAARQAFVDALKGDKTYVRQYRIRTQSGRVRWLQEWGQIICNEDGKIDSVMGILIDITEHKRAEMERLRAERRAGKYLIFLLNQVAYGIQIVKIKEIIGIQPITRVPKTPDFVNGVINLRGKIIPVVDLRRLFGLEASPFGQRTCIIVLEVQGSGIPLLFGAVVDEVREVQPLRADDIEDAPRFGMKVEPRFILGMAKKDRTVITLLDIDRVFHAEELQALQQMTSKPEPSPSL